MRLLFALLLSALVTSRAEAGEVCVSFFAAQSQTFPARKALTVFKGVERPCVSILLDSFGVSNRFFRLYRALPQPVKVLQVHVTNQSCVRLGRCQPREAVRSPEQMPRRARRAARICERFGFECFGTPGLEDGWSNEKAEAMTCAMREVFPYDIFRNPLGREARRFSSRCAHGLELHDLESKFDERACLFNNDGFDIDFGSRRRPLDGAVTAAEMLNRFERYRRDGCNLSLWWNNQGARNGKFLPPRRRIIEIYRRDILGVNFFLRRLQYEKNPRCAKGGVRCLSTRCNDRC